MKYRSFRKPRSIHSRIAACWFGTKSLVKQRLGSVLLLVVVVVGMLTLAAYNFTHSMLTEYEAAAMATRDVQSRATADSGLEFAATLLGNSSTVATENLIHNPQLFMGRVVSASTNPKANCRFTIISPVEHDTRNNAIRYGLMDESAKFNLNYLPNMGMSDDDLHTMMLNIPNMTVEIVDAMLDWIDSDDTPRPFGAESDVYQGMSPPYKAKNGPIETIDELLKIKGMTPALLYGEDANRNGLLDPNENDGDASPPLDNANGVLDHGFVAFFTVNGRESNRRMDGKLKINVNDGFLTDLYDALLEEFDENTAKFIIGYRISGPKTQPAVSKTNPPKSTDPNATTTTAPPQTLQDKEVAEALATFLASAVASGGSVTRGGIDLSKGGPKAIDSLWQLVGSEVQVKVDGANKTLESPWPDEPSTLVTTMPDLLNRLTTTKETYIEGRININQARREILLGLPTMTEEIVNAIVGAQRLDSNGQPSLDTLKQHNTTAWLYAESICDLPGIQALEPYITSHGDIYRAQVLGFFDGGGPVSRIEALIDATQIPPRIISQRDLNELGRGYSRLQLLPTR